MGFGFNFFAALAAGFVASLFSAGGFAEVQRMSYLLSDVIDIMTGGGGGEITSNGRSAVETVPATVGDCGPRCVMNGGRCVLGTRCLCSLGSVGRECGTNRREWVSFMEVAPEAAIGPGADVPGGDPVERWSYMWRGPMLLRSEIAARFLTSASDDGSAQPPPPPPPPLSSADGREKGIDDVNHYRPSCRHVLEIGGLMRPLHTFFGDAPVNATNLDPLSRPALTFDTRGTSFRLSLPVTWEDYTYDGSEDCFAFQGIHCDAVTKKETWNFLSDRAERVVVEMAAGEDILKCVEEDVLPRVTGPGWRTVLDADMDLTRSTDAMGMEVPRWRMVRRMMLFERTAERRSGKKDAD